MSESCWQKKPKEQFLKTEMLVQTFRIQYSSEGFGEKSIQCGICDKISFNQNDIKERYCGFCHIFHDTPRSKILFAQRWAQEAQKKRDAAARKNLFWSLMISTLLALMLLFVASLFSGCSMQRANRVSYWLFADHLYHGERPCCTEYRYFENKRIAECRQNKIR